MLQIINLWLHRLIPLSLRYFLFIILIYISGYKIYHDIKCHTAIDINYFHANVVGGYLQTIYVAKVNRL